MDELTQKIVGIVESAGNSITWADLMSQLEYRETQQAMPVVRAAEQNGLLSRVVGPNPDSGKMELVVHRQTATDSA